MEITERYSINSVGLKHTLAFLMIANEIETYTDEEIDFVLRSIPNANELFETINDVQSRYSLSTLLYEDYNETILIYVGDLFFLRNLPALMQFCLNLAKKLLDEGIDFSDVNKMDYNGLAFCNLLVCEAEILMDIYG